jgi:hypothetical protein
MSFYEMSHKGRTNAFSFESNVVIEKEQRDLLVLDPITRCYRMPDYPEPVPLTLRLSDAFYDDYKREYTLRFSHYPYVFPNSDFHVCCLSTGLKNILTRFVLPTHRFYSAEVTNPVTGEKRNDYWILLLKNMYYSEMYFPGTEWEISDRYRNVVVERFEKGRIKSIQEITSIQKRYEEDDAKAGKNHFYTCSPSLITYKQPFDLIPFTIDDMLVSEALKTAIEQSGLNEDIGFEKLNFTIVTGYQDEEVV